MAKMVSLVTLLRDVYSPPRQNNDIHHHNTRQSKNLHLSAPKTNWAKQKLTYQAALDFNLLSPEIQETASILLFKKKLERIS